MAVKRQGLKGNLLASRVGKGETMKRSNKFSALLLVLVLTASVLAFTACGDDTPAPTPTPTGKVVDRLSNLSILVERDNEMINTYSMIAVDSDGAGFSPAISRNEAGADAFIQWMLLASTKDLIASYGKDDYGEQLFYNLDDAVTYSGTVAKATDATKNIKISTTTSVNDSKLMNFLVPVFEKDYGYDVDIVSAGTGAAIQVASDGNCDLILVHSKSQEEAFIEGNYARTVTGCGDAARIPFMYNFFVLVGPSDDPAGVKAAAIGDGKTVADGFAAIATSKAKFISRGDKSGTHTKEIALWTAADVALTDIDLSYKSKAVTMTAKVKAPCVSSEDSTLAGWYYSAGQGMGICLLMANELDGYCLTDKATFLTYKNWITE
jgi:ABC-type tungstate transport system, permease component